MDNAGRLGGGGAAAHGPGARFLGSRSEKCQQLQQRVARTNQAIETRVFQTHVGEKLALLVVVELRELGFDGGADGHHRRAFGRGDALHRVEKRIVRKATFGDVGHVEHGLRGQRQKLLHPVPLGIVQRQASSTRTSRKAPS